ncbi:uncharacterized protein [Canis lupus baileyi]|uniref:translation initiation factor IF-2-like n=1 Tax=Canis lupus dingo TaxID=286419 RepID=UPI0018F53B8C|nr:translation initiation factor IF-2-like isoform X1 [Canis lupus familiaris]XP_038413554.1 translation initiation factor IF-2-like isoform X1 [Canis lupus familiaris]XP_038543218.1 translation initiation factor IF-2-like isoform X1 [Canis lupus familiaris]XP_048950502.1 translation initiation factor IF-2-like [Canis lupus dingo]
MYHLLKEIESGPAEADRISQRRSLPRRARLSWSPWPHLKRPRPGSRVGPRASSPAPSVGPTTRAQAGRAVNKATGRWAAERTPVPTRPRPLTSEFRLTSRLRAAALHFRQEPPSNLRATHFRALTGRGAPTGNGRPPRRRGGGETREEVWPPRSRLRPLFSTPGRENPRPPGGPWRRAPPPGRERPGSALQDRPRLSAAWRGPVARANEGPESPARLHLRGGRTGEWLISAPIAVVAVAVAVAEAGAFAQPTGRGIGGTRRPIPGGRGSRAVVYSPRR